jgi:hypothetical protein
MALLQATSLVAAQLETDGTEQQQQQPHERLTHHICSLQGSCGGARQCSRHMCRSGCTAVQ